MLKFGRLMHYGPNDWHDVGWPQVANASQLPPFLVCRRVLSSCIFVANTGNSTILSHYMTRITFLLPNSWCHRPKSWWSIGSSGAVAPTPLKIGCKLLLFTGSTSHTGFRLVPKPMILNDLERRSNCGPTLSLR